MENSKKIYFGLLLVIVFLTSTMYFSYAFFTSKNEEHGKLNIVAGTLDYKIESNDLENNQITVKAHEIEKVELSITSLNNIKSLYELYYNTENDNDIEIGYSINSIDKVSGEVEANSKKNITVIIKNNSSIDKVITLGVQGGFTNNQLELTKGKSLNNEINLCNYEAGKTFTFNYTGDSQLFTTLCEGSYQVELWGAQGGEYSDVYTGGKGGYTKGNIYLEQAENLYVYVGQTNECINGTPGVTTLGYNGGGRAGTNTEEWPGRNFCGGGGSTDIRLTSGVSNDFNSLKSRIMVAGAGGGANFLSANIHCGIGGAGGGLIGITGTGYDKGNPKSALGGTQTSKLFGYGASTTTSGAGSGYYGGNIDSWSGGGGGSSFISGHNGCNAIKEESTSDNIIHTGQNIHYLNYSFYDTVMIDGEGYNWTDEKGNIVVGMPTHDGTGTMIGNSGNGYAKITYLGQDNNKYDTYKIGDEVTLKDGSKWHVLEYSDYKNQYVTLLSDYNLNSDGSYNDECGRDINSTYKCSTIAFDSDDTSNYDETDINNIGYFMKNTYQPLVISALPGTTYVSLPTANQLAKADSQTFTQKGLDITNSWLTTTNYWTKTVSETNSNYLWIMISESSNLYTIYANKVDTYGIRPVITTLKSNIVDNMSSSAVLSIGDSVEAIDGSKWHVLENSGSDNKYVTLLSDYNLNSDGTYNTSCQGKGPDDVNSYLCSTMAFDSNDSKDYDETSSSNIGYFIKNTYRPIVTKALLETKNVTLPTAYQIAAADGKIFAQTDLQLTSNSWLVTTNYWTTTKTPESYFMWRVFGSNPYIFMGNADDSVVYGARPVITTLKTNLLLK